MKRALDFWIFGGDLRQHWLARQLSEDDHKVYTYGLDPQFLQGDTLYPQDNLDFFQGKEANCVIFPLPVQNKKGFLTAPFHKEPIALGDLFQVLSPEQLVVGGQVKPQVLALAKDKNVEILDYFTREELTIANAVPTAEGCLQVAMERLPITLQDARILILGYGKVATATAQRLGNLGAKVTVAARRFPQLEQAKADGFNTDRITQLVGGLCCYDCIINTVPAPILGKPELEDMDEDCLVIDLASLPGGVDLPAAAQLNRTIVPALSLPGRVAPASAGMAIKRTLYHILEELDQKGS